MIFFGILTLLGGLIVAFAASGMVAFLGLVLSVLGVCVAVIGIANINKNSWGAFNAARDRQRAN